MTKISPKKAASIKADISAGKTQPVIARKHKVSRSIVSDIATGRVHKDVPWPEGEPPCPKQAGGQHKPLEGFDPTDEKVMELEAEIVHLTEERNREKAKVKAGAKIAGLFKAITKEMETRIRPMTALPALYTPRKKASIVEHCVMHLSDGHHDAIVKPEAVGGLEEYDFPISCVRAERY